MRIYDAVSSTPAEAKKQIKGGRISGFTDINPMYRIRRLTEQFGPCGVGWYYTPDRKWTEQAGDEILCFVDISLYIKDGDNWSKPIAGTGGSTLLAKEIKGMRANDECYKMATTDAISVACKQLGIGADVYWEAGESKYNRPVEPDIPPVVTVMVSQAEVKSRNLVLKSLLAEKQKTMDDYRAIAGDKSVANMTEQEYKALIQSLNEAWA